MTLFYSRRGFNKRGKEKGRKKLKSSQIGTEVPRIGISGIRYPEFGIQYSILGIYYSWFTIRFSILGIWYSILGIRYSIFGIFGKFSEIAFLCLFWYLLLKYLKLAIFTQNCNNIRKVCLDLFWLFLHCLKKGSPNISRETGFSFWR